MKETNSSPVGKHSLLCFLKIGVGKHLKQLAKIMWNKLRHTRTKQMKFIIVFFLLRFWMIATSRLKPGTAEADKDSEFKTSDEEIEDFVERDGCSKQFHVYYPPPSIPVVGVRVWETCWMKSLVRRRLLFLMLLIFLVKLLKETAHNNIANVPILFWPIGWPGSPEGPGVCGFLHGEAGAEGKHEAPVGWRFQGWWNPSW